MVLLGVMSTGDESASLILKLAVFGMRRDGLLMVSLYNLKICRKTSCDVIGMTMLRVTGSRIQDGWMYTYSNAFLSFVLAFALILIL